jgi:hypothetical protein
MLGRVVFASQLRPMFGLGPLQESGLVQGNDILIR